MTYKSLSCQQFLETVLMPTLENLAANPVWAECVEPDMSVRYNSKIYDCHNGIVGAERVGTQLNAEDTDDPDLLHDLQLNYKLSGLIPNNEEERVIIEQYNNMIRKRIQYEIQQSAEEYQRHTVMISYSLRKHIPKIRQMLADEFDKRVGRHMVTVERIKDKGLLYFYLVLDVEIVD